MIKNKRERKRKYLAAIVAGVLAIAPMTTMNANAADSDIIHEVTEKQTITKGVTHENIIKFTTNGWYNINIMTVDLSNQYVHIDTLTNTESIGRLATTKKLAAQRNAVAAVNASFFTPTGSGFGHPVGTVIQSSNILCATNDINRYGDTMASISLDNLNKIGLDYWKSDMNLISPNGMKIPVAQYNKPNGSKFADITVFDKKWGAAAVGATEEMPDITQMVVADGKVSQFLISQPPAIIPENGFIVVTRTAGTKTLQQAFAVGDSIVLSIGSTPGISNKKMSVSGSSILIKNGTIPETFSFAAADVMKNSPKTAIGSSKDGRFLYMVTVDGRQTASIGLSMTDMALLMQSIGAYHAINMDGGGSTTMVARPVGSTEVQVVNKPSDGLSRGVSTAIGVFTSAPAGSLAGMAIETSDRYMFTNTTRAFTVKGYDSYNNPIEINQENIKWSVSGVKGTFKGNVFRPSTYGEGKITAKTGKITASIYISVLSTPARLILSSSSVKLPVGKTKTFSITGVNPRGYMAAIDPMDVKWTINDKIGTFTDGIFTATARGASYIGAAVDNAKAYCTVSVSDDITTVADKFEADNGTFLSYPDTVEGGYSISKEQKVSGKSSGKLTYNFVNAEETRAAYMVLANEGFAIEKDVSKIGLQVYNDHENSGWLRAELIDSKGAKRIVDIAKTMDWVGWKYVEASLEGIEMPSKLTRLYLVQVNPEADSGSIYFDELTVTKSGYPDIKELKVPEDIVTPDETNKAVAISKVTAENFRFGVLAQSRVPASAVEKNLVKVFADKITKYLEIGAVVGTGSHETVTSLVKKKPVIATHGVDLKSTKMEDNKYSFTSFKNSGFFKLDTRNRGLRLSDPDQWQQFMKDLDSFKGKNVFIFMENSPDTFSDKLEMALFKDTISRYRLRTLRNVWVFFNGDKNESHMEKGVKYLSTAGYEVPGLKEGKTADAQYILVTVKGSAVTYVYKPIE